VPAAKTPAPRSPTEIAFVRAALLAGTAVAGLATSSSVGDSQKRVAGFSGNQVVSALRVLDGETVCDERADPDFLFGKELEERLHVARFGPAHVADGVVAAFLFVGAVVPAGTVRTRDAEVEFFFVVGFAFDLNADRANGDHNRALASDGTRQIDRIAAGSFRSDQNGIYAHALGTLQTEITKIGG
jgi:hypothetical protein